MAADNSNGANIEELTGKTEQFIEDNSRNLIIAIAAVPLAGTVHAHALRSERAGAFCSLDERAKNSISVVEFGEGYGNAVKSENAKHE